MSSVNAFLNGSDLDLIFFVFVIGLGLQYPNFIRGKPVDHHNDLSGNKEDEDHAEN